MIPYRRPELILTIRENSQPAQFVNMSKLSINVGGRALTFFYQGFYRSQDRAIATNRKPHLSKKVPRWGPGRGCAIGVNGDTERHPDFSF